MTQQASSDARKPTTSRPARAGAHVRTAVTGSSNVGNNSPT
ncbi:hypothetical protein OG689_18560 [Kitasatospora sp. NBC_00240]|nr:hypothetical protein [Kitasatospora sp. NBC_00240]MCX5211267.1 hypothetical protein [Kitasatospora sp. NBC_00240]